MRPIENESNGFVIEVMEGQGGFDTRFKTCWLCHEPHSLTYMCSECWHRASEEMKISAYHALREAVSAGYRTIYQISPTSYEMGERK